MNLGLNDFGWQRPASAPEAVALLGAQPGARLVAGGTDLLPNLRRGLDRPAQLIDVSTLPGSAQVTPDGDRGFGIGAGLTLAALGRDPTVLERLPALAEAARAVAGPGHRSAATVGGNLCQDTRCVYYNQSEWWRATNRYCLKRGGDTCHVAPQGKRCHAAFCSDLAPVLLAADAQVELLSPAGSRRLRLADLYRDDGASHLTLAHDELLVAVQVPALPAGAACAYRKARVRGAMDFPLAGVAVMLALREGVIAALRVGLSGTNSHPLALDGTSALLGRPVDDDTLAALAKLVAKQVSPMRTTVTASNYRRQVAAVLVKRLLGELAAQA
jgi:4-hydroxybenzoyl-CoA reductase subunit beta